MISVFKQKDLDLNILAEQVKVLYRALLPLLIANLLCAAALVYGLWGVASQTALIVWMSLVSIMVISRFVPMYIYRRHAKSVDVQKFARYFVIGSAFSGLVWGVGSVVLYPSQQLAYQLFMIVILVAMGAGSVSSVSCYQPAFFAYFPVSLLPLSIRLMFEHDAILLALGFLGIVYVIAMSYFGITLNRSFVESLTLRFENIDLVKQLREQKQEAEQANMATSKFLAAASHDLRQPLHALTLFTSVLDESIKYPKVRRVVDQIKASVDALQNLFNALLDISRLDAGVMKVEKSDFNLQPLFEKLANDFTPQAKDKGLQLLWPDCPYSVHTDQNLLEQILRNYISNAIRYTETGEIRITCETNEVMVTMRVIDSGPGIPIEQQHVIFEEFHQLSNPERDRSKGLGLGLAIVQRTASLLGHDIGVESQPGKGSTFSISVDQSNVAERASEVATQVDIHVEPADKALMVVIDDETSVREGTQTLLEMWGYDVVTASDREKALAQLKQQDRAPDGIIADYRLRENRTGVEAIHAIHEHYNCDIPALIITGDIGQESLREVNDSGFQMLHKPVAPAKLRAFLRHVQGH